MLKGSHSDAFALFSTWIVEYQKIGLDNERFLYLLCLLKLTAAEECKALSVAAANLFLIKQRSDMLETVAIILVVLWLIGVATSYTMGGLVHGLLVIAIVVILVRVIQGRRI